MGSQGVAALLHCCICVPNFRVMPEKNLSYLRPELGYMKSAVRSRSFQNVRNKRGVSFQVLERSIYLLVLMILFGHCHTNNFL